MKLKSIPQYALLNPYKYGEAYLQNGCLENVRGTLFNDSLLLTSTGLILRSAIPVNIDDLDTLVDRIINLLRYLRYISHQFDLRVFGSVYSITPLSKISRGQYSDYFKTASMYMRSHYFYSMVNWPALRLSDKLCHENKEIPIYEEILLSALLSKASSEYRSTILYSAIALESLLANSFEIQYSKIINSSNHKKYRLVNHNNEQIDPIYKAFMKRSDFKKLLHEVPLYLFNKSLLLEKPDLFRDAMRLYKTRNKIVHWGAPFNSVNDEFLQINEAGSKVAINTTLEVFKWMNIDKYSKVTHDDLIELA